MPTKTYRWASPGEWLKWAYGEGRIDDRELLNIVLGLDSDTILDNLESAMEDDGYFDASLGTCKDCDEPVAEGTGFQCQECHEWYHNTQNAKEWDAGGYTHKPSGRTYCWDCAINVIEFEPEELEDL